MFFLSGALRVKIGLVLRKPDFVAFKQHRHRLFSACVIGFLVNSIYIETPFNTFENRADPGQATLVRAA